MALAGEQQSLRSMDAGKSTYGQHSEPTPTIPPHEGLIELQQAADAAGESPSVLVTAASDGRWLSDIDLESRIKDQKAAVSPSSLKLSSLPTSSFYIPMPVAGTAQMLLAELSMLHCCRPRAGGLSFC